MTDDADKARIFEAHRAHLRGIAYRMTGTLSDAEDVLQDAYLRWQQAEAPAVEHPRAYLSQVVTRLCIDLLGSARLRRETYVGPWLPEPILDSQAVRVEANSELAADISVALMLALELLSPLERAAFLLHDVFDADYEEIARTLSRSESACRQLVARARAHVRARKPRHHPTAEETERVLDAFRAAAFGNLDPLRRVLAEDVVVYTDGGGRVSSATRPVMGRERCLRFFEGLLRKLAPRLGALRVERTPINGMPGIVLFRPDGVEQTLAFDIEDGMLRAMYSVRNPEKLSRVSASS